MLYFILSVLFLFQGIFFIVCENINKKKIINLIERYVNQSQSDLCLKHLIDLARSSEVEDNINSWLLTVIEDRQTLKIYDLMSSDIKCKLNSINSQSINRYCLYGKTDGKENEELMLGYCVPNYCDDTQARSIGEFAMDFLQQVTVTDNEESNFVECSVAAYSRFGFYATCIMCMSSIFLTLLATAIYVIRSKRPEYKIFITDKTDKFLHIFSVQNNIKRLMDSPDNDINCLHFIRVLTMFLLVFCHTDVFAQVFAENVEDYRNPKLILWQILSNGAVYVQTFFVIGGMLSTYLPLVRLNKLAYITNGSSSDEFRTIKSWLLMIINRYFRIFRLNFVVMLLHVYFLPYFNKVTLFVDQEPAIHCPKKFWKHVLFIQNFDYLQNCMIWTWYLAADFQLYLINRPIVWLFMYKPLWALVTSAFLIVGSSLIHTSIMFYYDFPPVFNSIILFPQYNINFVKYFSLIYTIPYTWLPSYQMGMIFGYIIYRFKFSDVLKLNLKFRFIASSLSVMSIIGTIFGVFCNANGRKNKFYDAFYVIVSPLCWSSAYGWLVIEMHCFSSFSLIKSFCKLKLWLILSNLSYGCYLMNMCVVFSTFLQYSILFDFGPRVYLPFTYLFILYVIIVFISYVMAFCLYIFAEGILEQFQVCLMKNPSKSRRKL